MGLFDRLMGRNLPERVDGRDIYFRVLAQSRDRAFFTPKRFPDTFDGRISVIALHMAVLMERLRSEGSDGSILSQALFDEMKDDFEIALREEGISDTGVKKRIKPMIGHFYDRLKAYTDALQGATPAEAMEQALTPDMSDEDDMSETASIAHYAMNWLSQLQDTAFDTIRQSRFTFPSL